MNTLVPLANGSEEMEAVIIIDVLRRAGWKVDSVSIEKTLTVKCSRGVNIVADKLWEHIDPTDYDLIVLPGGAQGAETFAAHEGLKETIRIFLASNRNVAAICAAPLVLQAAGVLNNRRATCHPAVSDELTSTPALESRVVIDDNIITSRGPGTAMEFALTLISELDNKEQAASIADGMLCDIY